MSIINTQRIEGIPAFVLLNKKDNKIVPYFIYAKSIQHLDNVRSEAELIFKVNSSKDVTMLGKVIDNANIMLERIDGPDDNYGLGKHDHQLKAKDISFWVNEWNLY